MATGLMFRLPIPVQPMRAIAATGLILGVNVTLGFLAGILLWAIFRRWNGGPARNNASKD
ncbi:MAG: hypothetical protein Q8O78_02975 [Candidatus Deferrimicrobium sp.]|nr:hypothetical protein [Candidatus Deferrimicrobium sp.]